MSFWSIVNTAEKEKIEGEFNVLRETIGKLILSVEEYGTDDLDTSINKVIEKTEDDIDEFINKHKTSKVMLRIIESSLNKNMYTSSKYNVTTVYNNIIKEIETGKINLADYGKDKHVEYTYNNNDNTKTLICTILNKINEGKIRARRIVSKYDELNNFSTLSKRELDRRIKEVAKNNPKIKEQELRKIVEFLKKDNREIVQEEYRNYTEKSSEELRNECINSIVDDIEFINKYGSLESNIGKANNLYKKIYINNYKYTSEEVAGLLSREQLQKLKDEQLVALAAFWNNKASKRVQLISTAIYILSHPEVYSINKAEDGKLQFEITDEMITTVDRKVNVLRKICFEIFDEKMEKETRDTDISEQMQDTCASYGEEYTKYFNEILPLNTNNLNQDLNQISRTENMAYNLYKIKEASVKALLLSVLNDEKSSIKNYGYIKDKNTDIGYRRFLLLGFDVPGMNMPLRLHVHKAEILDVIRGVENGGTRLSKYRCDKDFIFSSGELMAPGIYMPVPQEKKEILKKNVGTVTGRDKYGNTIKHLYYIACDCKKMPSHMVGDKEQYIELNGENSELER